MLSADDIKFYLSVFKELNLNDVMDLSRLSSAQRLKPGEIYIAEGSLSHQLAYIKKGLIRVFQLKPNGEEVTLMLRWEKQFIASIDGVIYNRSSRYAYQAMEETVLLAIDYKKAGDIIDVNPRLSAVRSNLLLQMLSQAMDRVEAFVMLSAEERYLKLVSEKPDIVNRVADRHLATLLGITPVSLSRIRKRISAQTRH